MLGFDGMIAVEANGHSGGIALLWRNKDEVSLNSISKNHIDVNVSTKEGLSYRLTGIYRELDRSKRQETWQLIRNLASSNTLPWCLIGDMNNVLSQQDKVDGRPYPSRLLQGFHQVFEDCNLVDMDLHGYKFTWSRGTEETNHIEIRLDKALVNHEFLNVFQEAKISNLEVSTSDHYQILLEPVAATPFSRSKAFRFENAWLREPMLYQLVEDIWVNNT